MWKPRNRIQEAIARLVEARTTFATAHRLSTLKNADRLIILKDGEIAELGIHDEFPEKEGELHRLVQAYQEISKVRTVERRYWSKAMLLSTHHSDNESSSERPASRRPASSEAAADLHVLDPLSLAFRREANRLQMCPEGEEEWQQVTLVRLFALSEPER